MFMSCRTGKQSWLVPVWEETRMVNLMWTLTGWCSAAYSWVLLCSALLTLSGPPQQRDCEALLLCRSLWNNKQFESPPLSLLFPLRAETRVKRHFRPGRLAVETAVFLQSVLHTATTVGGGTNTKLTAANFRERGSASGSRRQKLTLASAVTAGVQQPTAREGRLKPSHPNPRHRHQQAARKRGSPTSLPRCCS